MKKYIIGIILILLIISSLFIYNRYYKLEVKLDKKEVLLNSSYLIKDFVKEIKNGTIVNGNEKVSFNELKDTKINILIKDKFNKQINKNLIIKVVDNEEPIISCKDKITTTVNSKIDLLKDVKVEDNSKEDIKATIEGKYDLSKEGTYKLKYKAIDSSGNIAYKEFDLVVNKKSTTTSSTPKYYIKVNKTLNVVMVYTKDDNNEYKKLVKTFICSAGENTPTGTYKTDLYYETLSLEGGVYGHYTTRFLKSRGMWFHSVPYFSKPSVDENGKKHWDNLEYEEYNKLGTLASLGCIRLRTVDAKWIYQNTKKGTVVEIYESDSLPDGVTKPSYKKIDVNSPNKGWDPTDDDPLNPWNT